jgi:5-formyltetrahydrofolate cyclo-ligase
VLTNRRQQPDNSGGRGLLATMATTTTAAAGDDDLIECKKATRKRVRAALKELTETQMSAESTAICASLLSTLQIFKETSDACVQRPLRLGLYVHCAKLREVDTRPLLKTALALGDACEVYVPIVDAPADGNDGVGPAMRFLKIQNLDKGEFIIFTYGQLEND